MANSVDRCHILRHLIWVYNACTGLSVPILRVITVRCFFPKILGPVVQSIVSLTSSLVVKILTVLISTISNSQVFLLKNVSSFCICKNYSFFSKNISIYAIFNDQSFNDMLTNNIIIFEQLGPDIFLISPLKHTL